MEREHFISPDGLEQRLGDENLSILCNFMYLPGQNLNGRDEFAQNRIPGSVYFDLDEIADQSSPLPHMVASPEQFARQMGELGVADTDDIVIYDGPGLFSAARIWWNLRMMGATSVRILEGGYDRWIGEDRPIDEASYVKPAPKTFNATFDAERVVDADAMLKLMNDDNGVILDARSLARFNGEVEEPRAGLRLGHMSGAVSLPFSSIVENGTLINNKALKELLKPLVLSKKPIVTTCGSGVTAAVLTLALTCAGYETHALFDGSWTQWGDPEHDYPIINGAD